MFSKTFWKAAAERAAKTAAQVAGSLLIVNGAVVPFDEVNWPVNAWIVVVSTVGSVLSSIVSAGATDGSPSLATEKLVAGQ